MLAYIIGGPPTIPMLPRIRCRKVEQLVNRAQSAKCRRVYVDMSAAAANREETENGRRREGGVTRSAETAIVTLLHHRSASQIETDGIDLGVTCSYCSETMVYLTPKCLCYNWDDRRRPASWSIIITHWCCVQIHIDYMRWVYFKRRLILEAIYSLHLITNGSTAD